MHMWWVNILFIFSTYIYSNIADVHHISLSYRVNISVFEHRKNSDVDMFAALICPRYIDSNDSNWWYRQSEHLHYLLYIYSYLRRRWEWRGNFQKRQMRVNDLTFNIYRMITCLFFGIVLQLSRTVWDKIIPMITIMIDWTIIWIRYTPWLSRRTFYTWSIYIWRWKRRWCIS